MGCLYMLVENTHTQKHTPSSPYNPTARVDGVCDTEAALLPPLPDLWLPLSLLLVPLLPLLVLDAPAPAGGNEDTKATPLLGHCHSRWGSVKYLGAVHPKNI